MTSLLEYFLKVKKHIGDRHGGNFESQFYGAGMEAVEQRRYQPGDEKRAINRKMSAKYDELFVNIFQQEKAVNIHLCCDVNYNRKGGNIKSFLRFFAALTYYGDREKISITGWLPHTDRFSHLEQGATQKKFMECLSSYSNKLIPFYSSSLQDMLQSQMSDGKRKLIIVVSDFLADDEESRTLFSILRKKHEVRLLGVSVGGQIFQESALSLSSFV